ncbi:hypothetical protein B0H66DRAFT_586727 [Apodospora peruviana]|uniref:Uncharacterized protein n=1 Tax=Apodospora peruviana TaxID=516989 RepID=A0AAE0IST1_9PEZI|nr:hypothetical protein B0H66DRAFT_586727 [Apodospora peruviana]
MATSHPVCVVWNGEWVVAQYGHSDGLDFAANDVAKIIHFISLPAKIERHKAGLRNNVYYKPITAEYTIDEIKCDACLHEQTSGEVLDVIAGADTAVTTPAGVTTSVALELDMEFALDSSRCKCIFVVDLDKQVLEIFGGPNYENKRASHRFLNVGEQEDKVPRLQCSFSLSYIAENPVQSVLAVQTIVSFVE